MTTWAYQYDDPLRDRTPYPWENCDRHYHDLGQRHQRDQLLKDCCDRPPNRLLLRQLAEIGDNWQEISQILQQLTQLAIEIQQSNPDASALPLTALLDPTFAQWLDQQPQQHHGQRIQQGHARNRLQALPPPR